MVNTFNKNSIKCELNGICLNFISLVCVKGKVKSAK